MKKNKNKSISKAKTKRMMIKEFAGQRFDPNIVFSHGIPQPEILLDMVQAYKLHPWVYAAVYAIATNFASVDYDIFIKSGKEGVPDKMDMKHEFRGLLDNPNPFISAYDMKE